MKRLLKTRDKILLVLADLGDVYEGFRDPGGLLGNYFKIVYGWVPYKYRKSNFRAAVERMLNVGYIEKVIKNGEPYLRLTSRGKKRIIRDFPIFELRGKRWNKICTLVVFDVKEIRKRDREQFRHWLIDLGAGRVQRSVYLISYDICTEASEAVGTFDLMEEVEVFPTTLDFMKDKKVFAYKVWQLEQLERDYQRILGGFKRLDRCPGGNKERLIRDLKQDFLGVLCHDPLLPKELLPDAWVGEKVRRLIKKYSKP